MTWISIWCRKVYTNLNHKYRVYLKTISMQEFYCLSQFVDETAVAHSVADLDY